jgi:hypothetical protein
MTTPAESDVRNVLVADSGAGGINTLATGGIYAFSLPTGSGGTGRLGISREATPSAFDSTTGKLKPTVLVKFRDAIPDGRLFDPKLRHASYRQICEVWLYDDGDNGFTTIESMKVRLYALLQGHILPGAPPLEWQFAILNQHTREPFGLSCLGREDYEIRTVRS